MSRVSPTYQGGTDGDDFVPSTIEELGNMIGKVAEQIIRENTTVNPLTPFEKGLIENGDTIEQAVVKLVESSAYDPTGAGALSRDETEKLAVQYFNDWTREKFKTTVDIPEMRKVLLGNKEASDLSTKIVSALSESDKHEKYLNVRDLMKWGRQSADGGTGKVLVKAETVAYDTTNSTIDYKGILVAMKDTISGMKFVNSSFNSLGLKRRTREEDIYILIPYKLKNRIDVNDLAGVFNLSKTEIEGRMIEIDTDAEDGYYYIYVVDKFAVLDFTRLYEMVDQKNADGLFWNYFLHTERLYALSPLFDACYIKIASTAPVQNNG